MRANGFKALNEVDRIELLSKMESDALEKAIMKKKKEVKLLKRIAERQEKVLPPMSKKKKKWIAFFFCLRKTFRSLDIVDRFLQLLWSKYMNSLHVYRQHTLYWIHTYKVKVRVDK